MIEREMACIYYMYEGGCSKGKKGTFRDACQICKKYKPRTGGVPTRANLKKKKMEKIKERDIRQILRDY